MSKSQAPQMLPLRRFNQQESPEYFPAIYQDLSLSQIIAEDNRQLHQKLVGSSKAYELKTDMSGDTSPPGKDSQTFPPDKKHTRKLP